MQPNLEFLVDLSKQAGEILKEGYGLEHQVEYKGPIDLVTEIDRKSEDLLVSRILEKFPGHTIIAEEGGLTAGSHEHSWFIDPVDGTSNYSKGLPMFCVSIAYAYQGKIKLAAVYDPMRDESFVAEKGLGAFLNGSPIHVSQVSDLMTSMLVTGFPYEMEKKENNIRYFIHLVRKAHTVRRLGSAVLDQTYVAMGRLDGYWEVGLSPWDIAAGTLIIEEAGGVVTRVNGEADYMKPPYDLVAANPALHARLIEELKSIQTS
ncbi:MAG TPA: inositol monophosphatase family protein [Pelolinea sp.]|nr:inositol monophosphatase family protein [Pelolinea sp.]